MAPQTPAATANRWKLIAVVGGVAVAIVIGLAVTRSSSSNHSSTGLGQDGPTASNLVRAGDLGAVDGEQALRAALEPALAPGRAPPRAAKTTESPRCEGVARGLQPQGAALAFVATTTWRGSPAEVFGFTPPGAPATSSPGRPTPMRVYVLARPDCRLLVFQSFAP